jgi:hypothetical protein
LVAPLSTTPESRTPESGAVQLDAERTQPPKMLHSEVPVGPEALPAWQAPSTGHQPQAGLVVHAAQEPMAAQFAGQGPQSAGQLVQVSLPLQAPSPQRGGHSVQSRLQVAQVSVPLQAPSPQTAGQGPQSVGQLVQVSPLPQVPSPQVAAQGPQSSRQVMQVSVPLQRASPQAGGGPLSTTKPVSTGALPVSTGSNPVSTGGNPRSGATVVSSGAPWSTGATVASSSVPESSGPMLPPPPRALHATESETTNPAVNQTERRCMETSSALQAAPPRAATEGGGAGW